MGITGYTCGVYGCEKVWNGLLAGPTGATVYSGEPGEE